MGTIVTLITDFGTADGYAGEMKGVLITRSPEARPVDVTHDVSAGDIRAGAWVLGRIWDRFPPGTVHLAVVDPGVGSSRLPLALKAGGRWFVGPDNGLATRVLERHPPESAWRLDPERAGLPEISDTFHGRDLFAPAAAHLASGGAPSHLGSSLGPGTLLRLETPSPERQADGATGSVAHVDRFGNLVTDIPSAWLPESPVVYVGDRRIDTLGRSFAEVAPGEAVLIRGSGGTLEISLRDDSAARRLDVRRDAPVRVESGA